MSNILNLNFLIQMAKSNEKFILIVLAPYRSLDLLNILLEHKLKVAFIFSIEIDWYVCQKYRKFSRRPTK